MWPPFCLITSCKRTLAFVTTFRHKSSESARHNFTMWALSCATFSIVKLCRALSEDVCRKVLTNARVSLQEVVRQNGGHIEHVLHYEQFFSLWGLILYQMSNVFVIIKICYVHNQWYDISCATLYVASCHIRIINYSLLCSVLPHFLYFSQKRPRTMKVRMSSFKVFVAFVPF